MKARILAVLALTGLLFVAAVTPNSAVNPQTPNIGVIQFTASPGTYKTLYVGGSNGSKITGIFVTNTDSVSHLITIQVSSSASAHCSPTSGCFGGAAVTIPITAGYATGVPAVNMMSSANWPGLPRDSDGNPYIYLPSASYTLEMTYATAITSGLINGVAVAVDF